MSTSFDITVVVARTIRLSDGRILKRGETAAVNLADIDQNVRALESRGYITIDPPLPATAVDLARYVSNLDKDPLFEFLDKAMATVNASLHRPVGTVAALKAILETDRTDKMTCLVEDIGAGYRFDAESTDTDDGSAVLKPDDVAVGSPGRWIKYTLASFSETDPVYAGDKGQPDGTATLDSGGKVPLAQLPIGSGNGLDADTVDGNHASALLARANHTGTQSPTTISPQGAGSGLDADSVDTHEGADLILRDGTQPFTGDQSMGGNKLTDVGAPAAAADAVTKAYADGLEAARKAVVKPADEVVTSSATLQNDDDLKFAMAVNEKWFFEFLLFVAEADATAGFKASLSGPASPTNLIFSVEIKDTGTNLIADISVGTNYGDAVGAAIATGTHVVIVRGAVENGANAGDLVLQWAQNVSDASATTVKRGSHLKAWRVA